MTPRITVKPLSLVSYISKCFIYRNTANIYNVSINGSRKILCIGPTKVLLLWKMVLIAWTHRLFSRQLIIKELAKNYFTCLIIMLQRRRQKFIFIFIEWAKNSFGQLFTNIIFTLRCVLFQLKCYFIYQRCFIKRFTHTIAFPQR